jgi:hypothetical protein
MFLRLSYIDGYCIGGYISCSWCRLSKNMKKRKEERERNWEKKAKRIDISKMKHKFKTGRNKCKWGA